MLAALSCIYSTQQSVDRSWHSVICTCTGLYNTCVQFSELCRLSVDDDDLPRHNVQCLPTFSTRYDNFALLYRPPLNRTHRRAAEICNRFTLYLTVFSFLHNNNNNNNSSSPMM